MAHGEQQQMLNVNIQHTTSLFHGFEWCEVMFSVHIHMPGTER